MEKLAEALAMDIAGIARAVGVTTATVKAWIKGRKPAERNRVKLARLVRAAHQEHSAAGRRWSASRDAALSATKLALMSADEKAIWERNRDRMREQFAPAAPAQFIPSAFAQIKAAHAQAAADFQARDLFDADAIEATRQELAARREANPIPTGQELADLFHAAAHAA